MNQFMDHSMQMNYIEAGSEFALLRKHQKTFF